MVVFDFTQEKKDKYYNRAQNMLAAAGFGKIKIDRTMITVRGNDTVKIHTVPWNKSILSREKLKELKGLPDFHMVHDRYTKVKPGKQTVPRVYEFGYIELILDEEDR